MILTTDTDALDTILRSTSPMYWEGEDTAVYRFNEDGDESTWKVEWLYLSDPEVEMKLGRVWRV